MTPHHVATGVPLLRRCDLWIPGALRSARVVCARSQPRAQRGDELADGQASALTNTQQLQQAATQGQVAVTTTGAFPRIAMCGVRLLCSCDARIADGAGIERVRRYAESSLLCCVHAPTRPVHFVFLCDESL